MPAVTVSTEEDPSPDETLTSTAALAITVSDGRLDLGRTALMTPERLVEPDAWVGHIPFAFWLVEAHRPRTLVELGTHSGNSYCAFCQAVAAFGTGTSCYAVDTWAGDPQAGFYGEEVYEELRRYHDPRYSAFSRLVRSTFDEAANHFADGSIDLLHIDGYHVYDAVRHDFDTWLPKLSDRGIVLFHDINVRERDFGAWRLWQEVTSDRPNFSFLHSHGLGVLGIGRDLPEAVVALLGAPAARAVPIRQWFAAAARSLQVELEASRLRETVRAHAATEATLAAERSRLAELEINRSTLESKLAEIEANRSALESGLLHATAERDDLRASATAASAEARRAQAESSNLVAERDVLRRELTRHQKACDHLTRELSKHRRRRQKMKRSLLRRSTRPLRAVIGAAGRTLKRIRRAISGRATSSKGGRDRLSGGAMEVWAQRAPTPSAAIGADALKQAWRISARARLTAFLSSDTRIEISRAPDPRTSIILVLYNQAELTFDCLQSIRFYAADEALELIIVDNASTDATDALLARIDGVKIVRSQENLHYLRGVNRAVREATGEYLLLLNNDALLQPGSLAAAIDVLASSEDVGAVGGRIMLPDGTLQEAGSIIWSDGTCTGFARGKDPESPEVMFRRDVDYCSGVFLLTRRRLFEELGLFDRAYEPAYYEETDYCVRLWKAGYRVVYEPQALILHYEFGSSASSEAALALQQRNHRQFYDRHRDWLAAQLPHAPENMLAASRRAERRPRVLYVEDRIPHEAFGAGYPRSRRIVHELVDVGAQLTFMPMFHNDESWPAVRRTLGPTVEPLVGATSETLPKILADRSGQFDLILVSRPHNMRAFLDAVGKRPDAVRGARIVYDAEALFARREILRRERLGDPLTPEAAHQMIEDEVHLTRRADIVLCVSEAEYQEFHTRGLSDVRQLGFTIAPTPGPMGLEQRRGLLFVGAVDRDESPNVDSLLWFIREVLPILRASLAEPVELTVIGPGIAPSLVPYAGVEFDYLGQVDDLQPAFAAARAFIAPTRFAAGVPLKVLTSAAYGLPCVATPLLAEQLRWSAGRDLLVGADAAGFASECVRLLTDPDLWRSIRAEALARCEEQFSEAAFRTTVGGLLAGLERSEKAPGHLADHPTTARDYGTWRTAYDTLAYRDRQWIADQASRMAAPPVISVLVPAYNTPEPALRRCLDSVLGQLYPHWELCVVDDASTSGHVAELCRRYAGRDDRIRFVRRERNGHISAASNDALALATGDFVALLDHDDMLPPHALYVIAAEIASNPDVDFIYTDEDKIDEDGRHFDPWFKTDWNPELMLSQNAVVHLAVYRRRIVNEIGGFRVGFEGSQDYDLTLRFVERTSPERIVHLPFVLYHWRAIPGSVALGEAEKTYPYEAARRAIGEHLDRMGVEAELEQQAHRGYYRVRWPLPTTPPFVSIIIPTKDKTSLLRTTIESITQLSSYQNFEIVVVDNRSQQSETKRYFEEIVRDRRVRVLEYDKEYSFAALNNWAVEQTDAEMVAFVNNDIEVIYPDWLSDMVACASRAEVGAVGARLLYPDGSIQHAGIVMGLGGLVGHLFSRAPGNTLGYFGRASCAQQYSAVTAACLVMRRELFRSMGGFDAEHFNIAFNDVDLGLRLNRAGYRVVWLPQVVLIHHKSTSLGDPQGAARKVVFDRECSSLRRLWQPLIDRDPFYNANLTLEDGECGLAFPPRIRLPWRAGIDGPS